MIPGPDVVVAYPRCGGLARYETLLSGNTLGARVWTDGKVEAPMLPRPPEVVRCGHCGGYYWLRQAEKVGYLKQWRWRRVGRTQRGLGRPGWRSRRKPGTKSPRQNPETDLDTPPKPGHGFWWGPLGGDPDTGQAPGAIVWQHFCPFT